MCVILYATYVKLGIFVLPITFNVGYAFERVLQSFHLIFIYSNLDRVFFVFDCGVAARPNATDILFSAE